MKKIVFVALFALGVFSFASAQTNDRAIGVRFGYGGELSYQQSLTKTTRFEIDLGLFGYDRGDFVISGIHQWLFAPNGGFNLYAGLGPQIGSYYWGKEDRYTLGLGLAGQFGLEYNIPEVPLQFSLDWRPSFSIIPSGRGFGYEGFALGLRYRF